MVKPHEIQFRRRFNFKKANWNGFSKELDKMINNIKPIPENYDAFNELVKSISRKTIPRGCRTRYFSALTPELMETLNKYTEMFEANLFEEETIEEGDKLLKLLSNEKRKKWCDLLAELDMKRSSKKVWDLIKRLNNDPTQKSSIPTVTPNQIAHNLLMNGKPRRINRECLNQR